MEKPLAAIKNDATVMWDVLQHGNVEDPVFEGIVRDFSQFDATLRLVFQGVDKLMMGIENLADGMKFLSEVLVSTLTKNSDNAIASDICRYRESVNKITRMDAPHSCIAKLRRDLEFNIVLPLQSHINNNKDIKNSITLRRKRLNEVRMHQRKIKQLITQETAKINGLVPPVVKAKLGSNQSVETAVDVEHAANNSLTEGVGRFPAKVLRDLRSMEASLEYAKTTFKEVDRPLFEWMMMLETYRLDIYDSLLQTVKYLQCEFLNESKDAMAHSIPETMQFRPMIEMTPEQLKVLVDQELRSYDPDDQSFDSTANILKKWERDGNFEDVDDAIQIDQMSLATLTSQGFEEELAAKALRVHNNDTQAALDMLLNNLDVLERMDDTQVVGGRAPTSRKWERRKQILRERAEKGDDEEDENEVDTEALTEEYKERAKARVMHKKNKAAQERRQAAARKKVQPESDEESDDSEIEDKIAKAERAAAAAQKKLHQKDEEDEEENEEDDDIGFDEEDENLDRKKGGGHQKQKQADAATSNNAEVDLFLWGDSDTTTTTTTYNNNTTPSKVAGIDNNANAAPPQQTSNNTTTTTAVMGDPLFDLPVKQSSQTQGGIGDFSGLNKDSNTKVPTLSDLFGPTPANIQQQMQMPPVSNAGNAAGFQSSSFRSLYGNQEASFPQQQRQQQQLIPNQNNSMPNFINQQGQPGNNMQQFNGTFGNPQQQYASPFSLSMGGMMGQSTNNNNVPGLGTNFPINNNNNQPTMMTQQARSNIFNTDPFAELSKPPPTTAANNPNAFAQFDKDISNLIGGNVTPSRGHPAMQL